MPRVADNLPTTFEWSPHEKGDPLYVSPDMRMCPGCPDDKSIHHLVDFKKHRHKINHYSVVCRQCIVRDHEVDQERTDLQAVQTLTATLAKATKRRAGGPSFHDVLEYTCAPLGGTEEAFKLTGQVFKRVMTRAMEETASKEDMDRAVKVGATLISSAATCEKTKGPPVDLSTLTQDELQMILDEPAKQLIMNDPEFRKQLLSDPAIRRALLGEEGVDVIDVAATTPSGEPEWQ